MPFFHQNLSPLTRRHGYKIPDFEVDFRPKTASTSASSSPSNSQSSTSSSPEQQQNSNSDEEMMMRKKRNRRSKLKPDYFWTAPAPVWRMRGWRIEEEGGQSAVLGEGRMRGEEEGPFRMDVAEWRDEVVKEDSTAASSCSSKIKSRMSANRAWEFSSPEFGSCGVDVEDEGDDSRVAMKT